MVHTRKLKEFISGYIVVRAENIEEAVEMAKGNPIFKIGGSIEVREVLAQLIVSNNRLKIYFPLIPRGIRKK